jgi:hypothetical protein
LTALLHSSSHGGAEEATALHLSDAVRSGATPLRENGSFGLQAVSATDGNFTVCHEPRPFSHSLAEAAANDADASLASTSRRVVVSKANDRRNWERFGLMPFSSAPRSALLLIRLSVLESW